MHENLKGRARLLAVGFATVLAAALAHHSAALAAQNSDPPNASHTVHNRAIFQPDITLLADHLSAEYFDPKIGKAYASALRAELASGGYDGIFDPLVISKKLTADLQAVSPDSHLQVRPQAKSLRSKPHESKIDPTMPPTIAYATWLSPGVAYIRFNWFSGSPESVNATENFMQTHLGARSLIIDAREHRGGAMAELNTLVGFLFNKPTLLVDMDMSKRSIVENGSPFVEGQTMRRVDGPEGVIRLQNWAVPNSYSQKFQHTKVYYLISRHTGSAAEHLALALKRTQRAILIGMPTAGANHFGSFQPLGDGLEFDLPIGRTFDPTTGRDWEGVGVAPDIKVPPDEALNVAVKLASKN